MATIPYRPHIDGLRALAVLAVVFYHARVFGVSGGFVGVDIFFVISGFLITSVIMRHLEQGTFSVATFWAQRVRRIFPALIVVLFASSIAAFFVVGYPSDYQRFGTSLAAQGVFASNMSFLRTNSYFEDSSRFTPLLHLWSLSVEEQFYILFPLLLIALYATRKRGYAVIPAALAVIFFASLAYAAYLVNLRPTEGITFFGMGGRFVSGATNASAGFYLLPSRAWELLAGALLAMTALRLRTRALSEVVSWAGLVAILGSVLFFSDATPFPGIAALIPVIGALAYIAGNEHEPTSAAKLLSIRPLVMTGLMSYSLYLWHWPLIVFAGLGFFDMRSKVVVASLVALSFALAWLSYRYVEMPFQKRTLLPATRDLIIAAVIGMSLLTGWGIAISLYGTRLAAAVSLAAVRILDATTDSVPWGAECFERPNDEKVFGGLCRIGDALATTSPRFVLWGDSHAESLVPMLSSMAKSYGASGVVYDDGYCVPVPGVHRMPRDTRCDDLNTNALAFVRENDIGTVILAARWSYYVRGGQYGKTSALVTDSSTPSETSLQAHDALDRGLSALVQVLSREGKRVYIVAQVPEQFGFDIHDAFYRVSRSGNDGVFSGITATEHESYQSDINGIIDRLQDLPGVRIIRPAYALCVDGTCRIESGGRYLYRNEDHLSTYGTFQLEPLFTEVFLGK